MEPINKQETIEPIKKVRKENPWLKFVKEVRENNPTLSYKQALQLAKKTYVRPDKEYVPKEMVI